MRILKIVCKNVRGFREPIEINFDTSDRVRSSSQMNEFDAPVFKLKEGLYTQVILGFVGLNATGKTTSLELISLVLHVVLQGKRLDYGDNHRILRKLQAEDGTPMEWEIYFVRDKFVYQLWSKIAFHRDVGGFYFEDEILREKSLTTTSKSNLYDFSKTKEKTNRKNEENSPFLRKEASIAVWKEEYEGVICSTEQTVNYNRPYWIGRPDTVLLQCFDPNIKDIHIAPDETGSNGGQMTIAFKNRKNAYTGEANILGNHLLSSGTIKGLSLLPAMVSVFKHGGYLIIDEMENHLNKKLIQWFLEMFTDVRINPHGACLIFSTHYPELLDSFTRKDNILVMRRDDENYLRCTRFSDAVKRNELSRSKIILSNFIKGTAPSYEDISRAKRRIKEYVSREIP